MAGFTWFHSTNGEKIFIQAMAMESILHGSVGREKLNLSQKDFPHLNKTTLEKAHGSVPYKKVDILVGNNYLSLQPNCPIETSCKSCPKTTAYSAQN